jgi:hypothetical protein
VFKKKSFNSSAKQTDTNFYGIKFQQKIKHLVGYERSAADEKKT